LTNNILRIVSIADIHFGVIDPKFEYEVLTRDFTSRIANIDFDMIAICGDLFDLKMMSNNPAVSYAIRFVDDLVQLCSMRDATLMIIEGTQSHDNGQLSLFYHYMNIPTIDVRIVEQIKFEQVKGVRILCIPEKYGIPEDEYKRILFESGGYDLCFLHGTFRGSFSGSDVATLNSNHAPIFSMGNFDNCGGPILMGHYHIPGCYAEYAYYNGSAVRFRFGEEQEKGFLITAYDTITRRHYTELIPIHSHSYTTINIEHLINQDPKVIIDYIKKEKETKGIDYIRLQYNYSNENMNVVKNYFRNVGNVKFKELGKKDRQMEQIDQEILEKNSQYSYILDNDIGDYDKFCMYVNQNEGYDFITTEELIKLLEDGGI
jgi:DNA repair exonuclease SbcCD nuclease subunit